MRLVFTLLLAWTITPLLLELANRKIFATERSPIKGTPAWVITVVGCFVVSLIVNAVTGAVTWGPFDIFALTAIVYFGANSFFNLVIKRWFPTRKA